MSEEYKDKEKTPESDDLKVMNDASVHPVGTSGSFKGSGQSVRATGHVSRYAAQNTGAARNSDSGSVQGSSADSSRNSSRSSSQGPGTGAGTSSGGSGGGKVPGNNGTSAAYPGGDSDHHDSDGSGHGSSGNGNGASRRQPSDKSPREMRREAAKASTPLTLHQERELKKRRKTRRIIIFAIAEVLVLALIFGYSYFLRRWNQIQRPAFDEEVIKNNDLDLDTLETMKGYWTIAIFGVDSRDKALTKSTNADVNLICNLNMDSGEIKLVSVYRDTYLQISKDGTYNKINQAYFIGGPEQAVSALNRNLDLNITDYMTFNWKAVADAINVLGGVDIDISNAEFYYINSFITETVNVTGVYSTHLTHAGMNHLDGVQAVAYGRLRLMDTDYARTERQRKVIQLCFDKAKECDFDTLNRVLATVFPQVATSIDLNDIFNGLKVISRFHIGETTGFPQQRGDANMGKKGACVIPQTLTSNVKNLHEFLFGEVDYTPSSTVQAISAKISEDTQMYKEAAYIESVGTGNGVIQSDKESKAAEAADAESDKKYVTIYVKDADGNKVKKTVQAETDADGDIIQPETDADGYAVDYRLDDDGNLLKRATKPTAATTEAETDEDGNPVETTSSSRPTAEAETDEDGNPIETTASNRPTAAADDDEDEDEDEDDTTTRPTSSSSGGVSANPASSGETSSAPTSAASYYSAPTAADNSPQVVDAPGQTVTQTTEAAGPSPTAPTAAATTQETVSSNGPGGAASTDVTPTAGTVAAPGT